MLLDFTPEKTSFAIKKERKVNGKRQIITQEVVKIPPEFRIITSDVPVQIREEILNQGLNLKSILSVIT